MSLPPDFDPSKPEADGKSDPKPSPDLEPKPEHGLKPSEIETCFASALLGAKFEVPQDLTSVSAPQPVERFSIYRNNVHVSLIDALAVKYPAVQKIVGDEFFRGLARTFVRAHPPASPMIIYFGEGFDRFLAGFEHVQDVPYLADVARLEWLRLEAYHARDQRGLSGADLADIDPALIDQIKFELHPSLRLLKSGYPVISIWQANIGDLDVSKIGTGVAGGAGEAALIIRSHLDVEVLKLPSSACDFIGALWSGKTLGEANVLALDEDGGFDLHGALSGLVQSGAIVGFSSAQSDETESDDAESH